MLDSAAGEEHVLTVEPGRSWRYGVAPADVLAAMDGLDFLGAIGRGELPAPPIGEPLDFEPVRMTAGRAEFAGTPGLRHLNPLGTVHGGWASTLLDSAMGCALHTTLKAGQGFTTVELKVNFIRPIRAGAGQVRAVGTLIHRGSRTALAEGRLEDTQGRLLAHGTSTLMIFEIADAAAPAAAAAGPA